MIRLEPLVAGLLNFAHHSEELFLKVLSSGQSDSWLLVGLRGSNGRKSVRVGDKVRRQHHWQLALNVVLNLEIISQKLDVLD